MTIRYLLGPGFWIIALMMMAGGLWMPGDYQSLRPLIPVFLGGILFFTALKVELRDMGGALRGGMRLGKLGATALIKLIVIPLLAWGLIHIVAPDWALGVLVVMAMPAGLSSPAMCDLYRANVPFALIFTALTALLCPLTIPLIIQACDPKGTAIDPLILAKQAGYIVMLLATPLILAQIVRRIAPAMVQRHFGRWNSGAVLSSCLLIFVSISANRHAWDNLPQAHLLMPLLLCFFALLLAMAAGVFAHRWMPPSEAAAFGFCCLWMNNGLGVAFSDRFYHGNAGVILPPVLMQLPIILYVMLFGRWSLRRQAKAA